ncbi:DUF1440 domain-containing protein [Deinococcus sp. HMF7604]|uniref:DUF1440 domain-containing protein n=1 Tax=Deinococcus betulae TaxID=2873312 RepID=UPI001CCE3BBF|nr:DUF1440 domain-containing protein [Deinococcus betulae]MBZ9753372.1 DUF1440 domain-containing protein [Deinococcus betulae]
MTLRHPVRSLLVGAVAGLIGAAVKAKVEPALQTLAEQAFPPTPAEKKMVGADPTGRQDHMPPAEMVEALGEQLTGKTPTKEEKLEGQQVIHYAMGAALGATYSALAAAQPAVTRGLGVPAGAVMYAMTHASAVPATGFQAWPWQLPRSAVVWEAASHLVFSLTTELVRRSLEAALDRLD